jgi:hypothetical protein
MGARVSIRAFGQLSGGSVQSGEVNMVTGANAFLFPIPFTTVSNIIVQDLNGVGINIDEPQNSLSVTGFSVTAFGDGPLVYIVIGTF